MWLGLKCLEHFLINYEKDLILLTAIEWRVLCNTGAWSSVDIMRMLVYCRRLKCSFEFLVLERYWNVLFHLLCVYVRCEGEINNHFFKILNLNQRWSLESLPLLDEGQKQLHLELAALFWIYRRFLQTRKNNVASQFRSGIIVAADADFIGCWRVGLSGQA